MPIHSNPLSKLPPNAHGESDIYLLPLLSTIQLRAWLTVSLWRDVLYPGPASTHAGIIAATVDRHRKSLLEDEDCRITSIVGCEDPEVGEPWLPVGFVKYGLVADGNRRWMEMAETREWTPGTHVPFITWFWPRLLGVRRRYGEELGRYVFVEILAVEPQWQRKGVGALCMEEVCREADEKGWPCLLEGTEEGRGLYEKWGFEVREELWLDLARWKPVEGEGADQGESWRGEGAKNGEGEGWYRMVVMVRPAKGQ